ncbi:hypothetical protein KI688_009658 [Linnemannia hyalina]|uniref:Uncharacterized protein n=1 Tax=Linnemannia hyalina TaxID=64524 RepID=A0A9P7Y2X8_9FUNG|nr:hypothetical protein KI688_009658 [Linnemannia hyalina]
MDHQHPLTPSAIPTLRPFNPPLPGGSSVESHQHQHQQQHQQHQQHQQYQSPLQFHSRQHHAQQQNPRQQPSHQHPSHGQNNHFDNNYHNSNAPADNPSEPYAFDHSQSAIPLFDQAGYQSSSLHSSDAEYSFSNQQLPPTPRSPSQQSQTFLSPVMTPHLLTSTLSNSPSVDPSSSALLKKAPKPPPKAPQQQQAMATPSYQSNVNAAASSQGNSNTSTTTNTSYKSASNKRKEMASPPVARSQTQGKKRSVSVSASSSTQDVVEFAFEDGSERENWLVARLKDSSIYLPLQADRKQPGESRMRSKAEVYRQLAEEFNNKQFAMQHSKGVFSTTSNGSGIKTKITRLQTAFKAAHTLRYSSGFGSTELETWKAAVESACSYYFELLPAWGQKWSDGVVFYADSTTDLTDDFITDDPPRKDVDSDVEADAEEEQEDEGESERQASPDWEDEPDYSGVDGAWSQEEEDEPLVRNRRLAVPAAARSRSSTARPPTTTPQRTSRQQEQRKAVDGDPSSSTKKQKKPKASKRDVTDDIRDLSEATRVTAQLELQKAEIMERVRMREIESSLAEKQLDFKLRMAEIETRRAEIEARKAETIAKVQAEKELSLERERWISKSGLRLSKSPQHLPDSPPRRRTMTANPKIEIHLTVFLDVVIRKIRTMVLHLLIVVVAVAFITAAVAIVAAALVV